MVQLKVLMLVKVGIIIMSNFTNLSEGVNEKEVQKNIRFQDSLHENPDTIKIVENDYKLILDTLNTIRIKILRPAVLQMLMDKHNPVISILYKGEKYIAKGNHIISSSVPGNCDMFYFTNRVGCWIVGNNNELLLYRINTGPLDRT